MRQLKLSILLPGSLAGHVAFVMLAICLLSGPGAAAELTLRVTPTTQNVALGEMFQVDVMLEDGVSTLGGGFDVFYDPARVEFDGYAYGDIGDPDFSAMPTIGSGEIVGFTVASFFGLEDGVVVTLTFRLLAPGVTLIDLRSPDYWPSSFDFGTFFLPRTVDGAVASGELGFAMSEHTQSLVAGPVEPGETVGFKARLTSTGSEPLEIFDVTLVGASDVFHIVHDECSGRILPAGRHCTVYVSASPTELTATSRYISDIDFITSDVFDTGANTRLTVLMVRPILSAPEIEILEASMVAPFARRTVSVTNVGTWYADIGELSISSRQPPMEHYLSVVGNKCTGHRLEIGESCPITFEFAPKEPGLYLSEYALRYGSDLFTTRGVDIDGVTPTGLADTDVTEIAEWTQSVGDIDMRKVVVTNKGSMPLHTRLTSALPNGALSATTDCDDATLLNGQHCTFWLTGSSAEPGTFRWGGRLSTDSLYRNTVRFDVEMVVK